MKILLGADPELFVARENKVVSAHGLVQGTKTNPQKVPLGAVQVDGMALEFNIDPAETEDAFCTNIQSVMASLKALVPQEMDFRICASAQFDKEYLASQPEEARLLGCDPDYNAYTMAENATPPAHPTLRTAAGHVHIGWTEGADPHDPEHFLSCITLVKQLDCFLGVPSRTVDLDSERSKLYGKAGAFRPKPYGCEYRVLSNWWLNEERYMRWVFRSTHTAIKALIAGKVLHNNEVVTDNIVQYIINNHHASSRSYAYNSLKYYLATWNKLLPSDCAITFPPGVG